jgi:hypothetical protein
MAASTSSTPARLMRLPLLAAALLAAGCSSVSGPLDSVGSALSSGFDSTLGRIATPFSGSTRNTVTTDSLTVRRVRGSNPDVAPVLPEAGNVWPEPEQPRPTLMSGPDEAMSNIPSYNPSLVEGAPAATSPVPTPQERRSGRRGSAGAPNPPIEPAAQPRSPVAPPFAGTAPMSQRPEGQVTLSPSGQPAVTTGQAGRVRGVTTPGAGGGGLVIRDGNVETWTGPDGQTRTRVVPQ